MTAPIEFLGGVKAADIATQNILNLSADGKISSDKLELNGSFNLIDPRLFEATGQSILDWDRGFLSASVALSALDNAITANRDVVASISPNFSFKNGGAVALNVPSFVPLIGGRNIASANSLFQVIADNTLTNDFVAAWSTFNIPFIGSRQFGIRGNANLEIDLIGADDIPPTGSFEIAPNTEQVFLTLDTELASTDLAVRVELPGGQFIDEADFASQNIAIIDELSDDNTRTVIVLNPTPGIWDIEALNPDGLGQISTSAFTLSPELTLDVSAPSQADSDGIITINFTGNAPVSEGEVEFFIDTDDVDFNGTTIGTTQLGADGTGTLLWDTTGSPTGEFFIYGVRTEGSSIPVFDYSPGSVRISEEADLSISAEIPLSIDPGETFNYQISVENTGLFSAQGVTVTSVLPEEFIVESSSLTPISSEDNVLVFQLDEVTAATTESIDLVLSASQDLNAFQTGGFVEADTFDPVFANNDFLSTIIVEEVEKFVDLQVTRSDNQTSIELGNDFSYILSVTNNGPDIATEVILTETIPSGNTFITSQPSQGISDFNASSRLVTAQIGELEPGETATVEITLNAFTAGEKISFTEVISNEAESSLVTNQIIGTTSVLGAVPTQIDLDLSIVADRTEFAVGDTVTLTLTLNNQGPGGATAIQVKNLLPSGLSFINALPEQGTYDPDSGIWDVGNMRDNLDRTLTINALAEEQASLTIDAEVIAVAESDVDSTANNNDPDEDDQVSVTLNVASIAPSLVQVSDDVFTLSGTTPKLKVSLVESESALVNELAVVTVDDVDGSIDGLAPGSEGYAQVALNRARPIFSNIADIPNGFETSELSSLLEFSTAQNLRFILVRNSTLDNVSNGITPIEDLLFSDASLQRITDLEDGRFSLAWKDDAGNTTDFTDLVVTIEATTETFPLGAAIQNQSGVEIIDLRDAVNLVAPNETIQAEFSVYREAAFDNYVGFYQINDADGSITDPLTGDVLQPEDEGYIQTAVTNRIAGIDLSVGNQETATLNGEFIPGSLFAPFIIVDASPTEILDTNTQNDPAVHFAFIGANSDGVDHIRLLGDNVFGFEDLPNGGDLDYNDVIVTANLFVA